MNEFIKIASIYIFCRDHGIHITYIKYYHITENKLCVLDQGTIMEHIMIFCCISIPCYMPYVLRYFLS